MRISDWSSDVCSSDLASLRSFAPSPEDDSESCVGGRRLVVFRNRAQDLAPAARSARSEERRVGKSVSVRVDLGGRRIIKKKNDIYIHELSQSRKVQTSQHTCSTTLHMI